MFQFENKKQALKFGFRKDITFSLGFPSFVYIKIVIQTGHVLCITRFPIKNDLNNGNRKLSMKERTFIKRSVAVCIRLARNTHAFFKIYFTKFEFSTVIGWIVIVRRTVRRTVRRNM